MEYFVEIAEGSPKNRNVICNVKDFEGYVIEANSKKRELYRSYYMYDEELTKHFDTKKTIRGYKGKYYLDRIIFDIDKGSDKNEFVLQRTREFVKMLVSDWGLFYDGIQVWFSGRGYHINIPNIFKFPPSNNLPNMWVETAREYFPEIDTSPFMATGLIRTGYSMNTKSQRFKVRLTSEEFYKWNVEQILELAEKGEIRKIETNFDQELDHSSKIKLLGEKKREKNNEESKLHNLVTCMQKLWERGVIKGRRHDDMMRLISAFRRGPLTQSAVLVLLKHWANNMEEKEIEKYVNDIYAKDYRFGCNDKIFKEFCTPQCYYYKYKDFTPTFYTADQMEKKYVNFIRTDYKDRMINLKTIWGLKEDYVILPGETVLVIGDTKLGKTGLIQNLCISLPNHNIDYYTFETPPRLLYRRSIQIAMNMTKQEVDFYYMENNNSLSEKIQHIKIQSASPDIMAIEKLIAERKPHIVVLDTVKATRSGRLGEFSSKEEKLASYMKTIAQTNDIILIGIHHIPKGKSGKALNVHSGFGGAGLEQMADKIIGIEGKEELSMRTVSSLGARDEAGFKIKMNFNKSTFRLTKIMEYKK